LWFERQIAQQRQKRDFTDPLYAQQWHLHPGGSFSHVDVNVRNVWEELNITGHGVVIAVVDDGLEYTHPDIAPNYVAPSSYDFNYDDPYPYPDSLSDDHGTSAGGVAGARDNDVCGVGSSPRAGLAGSPGGH
jgi:subtilisin family serine protease